jgi:uncharacterized RDD family membrane protein YckC
MLHVVVTAEQVPFSYRVAGMGSRLLAWLVDSALLVVLGFIGVMIGSVLETGRGGLGQAVTLLWVFGLLWGYFLLFEWLWHGQTPGKRLLGIRVIHWRGTSLGFVEAAVRNVLRVVDALPLFYGVGFLVAACSREHRRLGDLAAGTLVVHVEPKARPLQALHEGPAADLEREALVRQRLASLTRLQKQTLLDLCLRRDQLRVQDRARLFAAVAAYLKGRLDLAPEAYQSEEKFVLQLASLLGDPPATVGAALPFAREVDPRRSRHGKRI